MTLPCRRLALGPLAAVLALLLVMAIAPAAATTTAASSTFYEDYHEEPRFEYDGDSHYGFGRALGKRFQVQIQERLEKNAKLQTLLLPYHATDEGKALYARYFETHNTTFPVRPCVQRAPCCYNRTDVCRFFVPLAICGRAAGYCRRK